MLLEAPHNPKAGVLHLYILEFYQMGGKPITKKYGQGFLICGYILSIQLANIQ